MKYQSNDGHKHIESSYITTLKLYKRVTKCLLCGFKLNVELYKPVEIKNIPMELDLTGISEEGLKNLTLGT
jgi:hypothetical protein